MENVEVRHLNLNNESDGNESGYETDEERCLLVPHIVGYPQDFVNARYPAGLRVCAIIYLAIFENGCMLCVRCFRSNQNYFEEIGGVLTSRHFYTSSGEPSQYCDRCSAALTRIYAPSSCPFCLQLNL